MYSTTMKSSLLRTDRSSVVGRAHTNTTLPAAATRRAVNRGRKTTPAIIALRNTEDANASITGGPAQHGRRAVLGQTALTAALVALTQELALPFIAPALAADKGPVFVAGATGLTGQLVVRELVRQGIPVIAGVRSVAKAEKLGLNVDGVSFRTFDVTAPVSITAAALEGAASVICTIGFVPGNPLKFKKAAHDVDNVGTVNLIDAAVEAKVPKFVLMTSILTNGRAAGQEKSPGFVITNAFGGVLDEKLVAEQHLRSSGLDYTIVRPGGLKGGEGKVKEGLKGGEKPPADLNINPEDVLFSGEIDRSLVADVLVDAAFAGDATKNRVLEIIETGTCLPNQGCPDTPGQADRSAWFA